MKRLVICCDGTWNGSDTREDRAPTNVRKLWELVRARDDAGVSQVKRYYAGVGVRRFERLRGGALGWGLSRTIKEAYRDCATEFEPGDELFLFGFSRGAYTARSLAGLIRNAGLLTREHLGQLDAAYELYRDRSDQSHPRSAAAAEFRTRFSHETRIKCVGVWDTVGSLGIPKIGLGLANALFRWRWSFHDVELSTSVDHGYQALAVDERRGPFSPTLWTQRADAGTQTIEQVWFAGVHSDVGGGYPDSQLSDIPLLWMLDKAAACELAFDWAAIEERLDPNPLGPSHDSLTTFYKVLDRLARPLRIERARLRTRPIGDGKAGHEFVASSVILRQSGLRPRYDPPNVRRFLAGGGKTMSVRVAP